MKLGIPAAMLTLALGGSQSPDLTWTTVTPPYVGFTIEAPGELKATPDKPTRYPFVLEDSAFIIDVDMLEPAMRQAVARRDRATITKYLDTLRDVTLKTLASTSTIRSNSAAPFAGFPSTFFSADGEIEDKPFELIQRIVLTDDRSFSIAAIGLKGTMKNTDVDRFHGSFRLVNNPPASAGEFHPISFAESICELMPAIPLRFQVPADFASRSVGNIEAGCLWGARDDLDRVTANPDEGDFTTLRRGVFRARMSTNVVNAPGTNVFDALDGAGEAGIRRELEQIGGKVVVWEKSAVGEFPMLQIVADVVGDRVYMLYIGNTQYVSNVVLVNYYHPSKRSADDDKVWARFVAAVTKTP